MQTLSISSNTWVINEALASFAKARLSFGRFWHQVGGSNPQGIFFCSSSLILHKIDKNTCGDFRGMKQEISDNYFDLLCGKQLGMIKRMF